MSAMTNKDVMHAASMFAREHVRECCAEIREWQDTGLLSNGRVRELAKMLRPIDGICDRLSVAESIVQRVALDYITQPAQSVDVGAIRKVIEDMECSSLSAEWTQPDRWAERLTAALQDKTP